MTKRRTLRGPSSVWAVIDYSLRVREIYVDKAAAINALAKMPGGHDIVEVPFKVPFLQTITVK